MQTPRQIKVSGLIQKELALIFNALARESTLKGLLISVTKVRISPDLSIARVYLSIFPTNKAEGILQDIIQQSSFIKHKLSTTLKNRMRKLPTLSYFVDDSLDYIEEIDRALSGVDNPMENLHLLSKRKKV